MKQHPATAWIIEWRLHRKDSPIRDCDLRPHILPRNWRSERVFDYMRCLFWNSPLCTPFTSLKQVNLRKPPHVFIVDEGPRLRYGEATHLVAWHVKDLVMERDPSGRVVMEWTAPAGIHFVRETRTLEPIGIPTRRRYVWEN
jgi:hypothetical protein